MLADSFKHLLHTLLSALILGHRLGGLGGHGVYRTLGRVLLAAVAMGLATYGLLTGIGALFPGRGDLIELVSVVVPGGVGAGIYIWLAALFGLEEIPLLRDMVRRRLLP